MKKPGLKRLFYSFLLLLISFSCYAQATTNLLSAHADDEKVYQAAQQRLQLTEEKNDLTKSYLIQLKADRDARLADIKKENITLQLVNQSAMDLASASADLEEANINFADAQQVVDTTSVIIHSLEDKLSSITLAAGKTTAVKEQLSALQDNLNYQRELLKLQTQHLNATQTEIDLSKQQYYINKKWNERLVVIYKERQRVQKEEQLQQQEIQLQKKQQYWLDKLTKLNDQLQKLGVNSLTENSNRHAIETGILQAHEESNLLHLELALTYLSNKIDVFLDMNEQDKNLTALAKQNSDAKEKLKSLSGLDDLVERKINLLNHRLQINQNSSEKGLVSTVDFQQAQQILTNLKDRYEGELATITELENKIQEHQEEVQKALNIALARRQGLPGFSLDAWQNLGAKLIVMPAMAALSLNAFKVQVAITFANLQFLRILGVVFIMLLWFWLWIWCQILIKKVVTKFIDSRKKISDNVIYTCLLLLQRNIFGIFAIIGVLLLCWLAGLPIKTLEPILMLLAVWFIFKVAIGLARITLVETVTDVKGKDVKLYNGLKWTFLVGGFLTILTVLSTQLPVGYEVQDFFNRLFMLFLLVVAILLLRGWEVVPTLVEPFIDHTRPYLLRIVKLLCFLIPITLLSTAIIGFLGYVALAWHIFLYEGMFLVVLTAYTLSRGFAHDIMEWISELFIRRLRNGWLWTQAFLRPADKLLRFVLLGLAIVALFDFYGWGLDSLVVITLDKVLHYHLIELRDSDGVVKAWVTLMRIIQFVIAIVVLVWVSRWTREFSYRWLFARHKDIGLRNSLAAFTQYAVVTLGIFISLKIIGVDLSGLSYILGGMAIAIGFGLRDLTKNYVCGLLLLLERPVRTGDLVSVGEYEGEVTQIGMRSMTVRTWDNMDVLVPNADTFDKPFTNWTRQDSIVRTVIILKIHRNDDLEKVRELTYKVLDVIPEIVSDPQRTVFIKEVNESLVEFHVRYFINVAQSSRISVRSDVLFNLMKVFKENNIYPPHPQQDIYIKSLPTSAM